LETLQKFCFVFLYLKEKYNCYLNYYRVFLFEIPKIPEIKRQNLYRKNIFDISSFMFGEIEFGRVIIVIRVSSFSFFVIDNTKFRRRGRMTIFRRTLISVIASRDESKTRRWKKLPSVSVNFDGSKEKSKSKSARPVPERYVVRLKSTHVRSCLVQRPLPALRTSYPKNP